MMNERITFTLNNAEYLDTCNGRFYRTENGKKVRISKAEYEVAWEAYTDSLREEQATEETTEEETTEEQTNEQPEDEIIDYKGYKITGNESVRFVAVAPYGAFSPESYATVDEAKAAIDADIRVTEENAKKAFEKFEKTQKNTEVQKDSKKAEGTKKAKEKAPKTKKVPEGGAEFEINDLKVILTAKQVDFIKHLPDTDFWEHGVDSEIWVDCLCDDIGGQFEGKPMTVGAMISTLCEKGLGLRAKAKINNRKATAFRLTELGKQVAQKLGLK